MQCYSLIFPHVAIVAGVLDRQSSVRRFPGGAHRRAGDTHQAAGVGAR